MLAPDNATNLNGNEMVSEEAAAKILSQMDGQQLSRLKKLAKMFKLPHQGRHNAARAERARARISKRKAKRK